MKINLDSEEIARIVQVLEHYHAYLRSQRRDDSTYMRLAQRLRLQKWVSGSKHSTAPGIGRNSAGTRSRADPRRPPAPKPDREREKHRLPFGESRGAWKLQIEDAMAEWRSRQELRRAGVGVCLCHPPGSQAITPRAQLWKASGYEERLARRRR